MSSRTRHAHIDIDGVGVLRYLCVVGAARTASNMAEKEGASEEKILNFNIGVLGHIDSGKTALGGRSLDINSHNRYS